MHIPFNQLPPQAKLWIFPLDRVLSEAEALQFIAEISGFLDRWTAHNQALLAGCELRYGKFLLVATDEAQAMASGCSIDELYRRVRMLAETYGLHFLNNLMIQYRDQSGTITTADRASFAQLSETGDVTEETIVFDNSITSVGALHQWEVPAKESWHQGMLGPRTVGV